MLCHIPPSVDFVKHINWANKKPPIGTQLGDVCVCVCVRARATQCHKQRAKLHGVKKGGTIVPPLYMWESVITTIEVTR